LVQEEVEAVKADVEMEIPTFVFPPRGHFALIEERPLFSMTRLPSAPESVAASSKPIVDSKRLDRFLLTAVIITGEQKIALFRDSATGSVLRVREGDMLDRWRVDTVQPETVTVSNKSTTHQLILRRFQQPVVPVGRAKKSPDSPNTKRRTGQGAQEKRRPRRRLDRKVAQGQETGPEPADLRRPDRPKRERERNP